MKELSNTEAELKKSVAYKKKRVSRKAGKVVMYVAKKDVQDAAGASQVCADQT